MGVNTATLQGRTALNAGGQLGGGGNATEIGTTETNGLGLVTEMRVVRTRESAVPLELFTTGHVRPRDTRTIVLVQVKEADELQAILETGEITEGCSQRKHLFVRKFAPTSRAVDRLSETGDVGGELSPAISNLLRQNTETGNWFSKNCRPSHRTYIHQRQKGIAHTMVDVPKVSISKVQSCLETVRKRAPKMAAAVKAAVASTFTALKDSYLDILETASSSSTKETKYRLDYLDSLRGILAVVVIFHHFRCGFAPCNLFADETLFNQDVLQCEDWTVLNIFLNVFVNGTFCVFVFFVMSGFVLSYSLWKAPSDIWRIAVAKRYFRLALPCAASMILGYALGGFDWHKDAAAITNSRWLYLLSSERPGPFYGLLSQLVLGIVHGSSTLNNALWTLQIELFGSFLTFLLVFLLKGCPHRIRTRWLAFLFVFMLVPSVTRNRDAVQTRVMYDKAVTGVTGQPLVTHRAVDVDLSRSSHVISRLFDNVAGKQIPLTYSEQEPDSWDKDRWETDKDVAVLDKPKSTVQWSNANIVADLLSAPRQPEGSNLRIEMTKMHTWKKVNPWMYYAAFLAGLYISEYSLSRGDKGRTEKSPFIHAWAVFAVVCASYPIQSIEASRFFLWRFMYQIASLCGYTGIATQCFWTILGASAFVHYVVLNSQNVKELLVWHPGMIKLGKLSFSIYLVHLPLMYSFTSLFFLQSFRVTGSYFFACLIALILSLPLYFWVALYFNKYVDKPAIIISNRLGRKLLGMTESTKKMQRKEEANIIEEGIPSEVITDHSSTQELTERSSSFHGASP